MSDTSLFRDFTVNSLIDDAHKQWKVELNHHVFREDMANDIIDTSLIPHVSEDHIVWKAEKNATYPVKRAYILCVKELVDTSFLRRPGYWSSIWKLKVLSKIKNFIWYMCRGCLPTSFKWSYLDFFS